MTFKTICPSIHPTFNFFLRNDLEVCCKVTSIKENNNKTTNNKKNNNITIDDTLETIKQKPEPTGTTISEIPSLVPSGSQDYDFLDKLKAPPLLSSNFDSTKPTSALTTLNSPPLLPTFDTIQSSSVLLKPAPTLQTSIYQPSTQVLTKPNTYYTTSTFQTQPFSSTNTYFKPSTSQVLNRPNIYYTPSTTKVLTKPNTYYTPSTYFDNQWSVSPVTETSFQNNQNPTITIDGSSISIVEDPYSSGLTIHIGGQDRPRFRPLSALKQKLRNKFEIAKQILAQTLRDELPIYSSFGLGQ